MEVITHAVINDVPALMRCATDGNHLSSSSTSVISSYIPARAVENLRASDMIPVWSIDDPGTTITSAQDVLSQLLVRIQPISWQTEEVNALMAQGQECGNADIFQHQDNNNNDDDDDITNGDVARNIDHHLQVPVPHNSQNVRRMGLLLITPPELMPCPVVTLGLAPARRVLELGRA